MHPHSSPEGSYVTSGRVSLPLVGAANITHSRAVVAQSKQLYSVRLVEIAPLGLAIEKHHPDRIVTLGGECFVDLAPIVYLIMRYGDKLGVL